MLFSILLCLYITDEDAKEVYAIKKIINNYEVLTMCQS